MGGLVELAINIGVEELRNIRSLEDKMNYLANELQCLNCIEADVRTKLEVEESARGKKRKLEVGRWLNSVGEKRRECQILGHEVQQSRAYEVVSRGVLVRQVVRRVQEVKQLVEQSRCFQGLVLDTLEPEKVPLVTSSVQGHAFEHNMRKIMACMMDDNISSIGIHGMGGVGKTTLAMQVHDNLLRESRFAGRVYWVTVSQEFTIYRLQKDIATTMNIDISDEDNEKKRAAILYHDLKKKLNFVLILDDVWKGFEIEKIGVPLNICKLLVTSRLEQVCRMMSCNIVIIKVEVLSEIEAWELFQEKLKISLTSSHLELEPGAIMIAQEVARKCEGLPLGIITMARSMRGVTDIYEWRNALEELKEYFTKHEDMGNEVLPILLYSYYRLRNPILQRCFLFCSLYPEDDEIEKQELVRRFVYEEIMDKRNSLLLEFDQGYVMLSKLESACLLVGCEDRYVVESVKMHDLIRDMALWVTRAKDPRFMVKAGLQLREVPAVDKWADDLDRVSLMCNQISIIPDGISPMCPSLSSLYLNSNPLTSVSDSFFVHMKSLQTLNLSRTNIVILPESISLIVTLKALLLRYCTQLVSIPSLENLKALVELDLFETSIDEVICGLESLTNLKCLEFQHIANNNTAPLALNGLKNLQRLILSQDKLVGFEEIKGMRHLEEFEGGFIDVHEFRQFIISINSQCQLQSYKVKVGKFEDNGSGILYYESGHSVLIKQEIVGEVAIDEEIMLPLRELNALAISDAEDMKYLLRISCPDEELKDWSPLECLEFLVLDRLSKLKNIIEWEGAAVTIFHTRTTFSRLTKLRIEKCNSMKKLLPRSLVDNLRKLECLEVIDCCEMKEIIGENNEGEESTNHVVTFPELKILHLIDLPELKIICKSTITCVSINFIIIQCCRKLEKIPLSFPLLNGQQSEFQEIDILDSEREWWDSLNWDHPGHKDILEPFLVFY